MPQDLYSRLSAAVQQNVSPQAPQMTMPAPTMDGGDLYTRLSKVVQPETSAIGNAVNTIGGGAKTAVTSILDILGRPKNALFGYAAEGGDANKTGSLLDALVGNLPQRLEGARQGLMGEKEFSGKDLITQADTQGVLENNPYYSKSIAGLGLDLAADPTNVFGVGEIKAGIGLGGKALGAAANVARKVPGVEMAVRAVRPLAELDAIPGLRDFARLAESGVRSIGEHANENVLRTLSPKFKEWRSKLPDQDRLVAMAHALDTGNLASLSAEEQRLAGQFKQVMGDQWTKEVRAGQQNPVNQITNYVPYITKGDAQRNVSVLQDISGTTRHAKERTYQTLADAVKGGNAEENLATILNKRLKSGDLAIHHAETVTKAAGKFGSDVAIPGARKLDFSGLKRIRMPEQALQMGMSNLNNVPLKDVYFPKEVADYLEKAHVLWNQEDEVANTVKKLVTGWKSWVVATPQQHTTNMLGNIFNAYVHGDMNLAQMPKLVNEARQIVNKKKAFPSVAGMNPQQVEELARKYEVVGTSGRYENISDTGKVYNLNPLSGSNAWSKANLHFGQHNVEEPFRLAVFLKKMREGKSAEEAAIAVKDTFFDYSELTPGMKFVRDYGLAPFVTWMSKNIPLQLESLAKNPERYSRINSTTKAVQEELGGSDTVVPLGDSREGLVGSGPSRATRFAAPMMDLNKLPIGDYGMREAADDILGNMAAPVKMPIELLTNQKFYGGMPIDRDRAGKLVKPFDMISKLAEKAGLGGMVGIQDTMQGPMQNPYASYVLGNNPWQYYNKFLQALDPEAGTPETTGGESVFSLIGARSKHLQPKQQLKEIERRLKAMEP